MKSTCNKITSACYTIASLLGLVFTAPAADRPTIVCTDAQSGSAVCTLSWYAILTGGYHWCSRLHISCSATGTPVGDWPSRLTTLEAGYKPALHPVGRSCGV